MYQEGTQWNPVRGSCDIYHEQESNIYLPHFIVIIGIMFLKINDLGLHLAFLWVPSNGVEEN